MSIKLKQPTMRLATLFFLFFAKKILIFFLQTKAHINLHSSVCRHSDSVSAIQCHLLL